MTGRDQLAMRLQLANVGAEQDQRGQARRGDGVALGDRLHGIADRVQFVGDCGATSLGSFDMTARPPALSVMGPEGIERDDDAGKAKHAHDRDRHAIKAVESGTR